mgnify:CR=1 FL=1
MGAVPLLGIKVPIFISGEHAGELCELLAPWGMNLRAVSERPGAASALKLIRSIAFKGLAGVLLADARVVLAHLGLVRVTCVE